MQLVIRAIGAEKVEKTRLRWIGNDIMFSKGHWDIAGSYIRAQAAYRIYIRQAKNYNEAGAINTINRLISTNQLVIHNRCNLLSQEMLSWAYKDSENPLPDKEGYVLARALCLVTSVIREVPQAQKKPPVDRSYSKERTAILETLDRLTSSKEIDTEYAIRRGR